MIDERYIKEWASTHPWRRGADQVLEAAFASKIILWRNLRFVLYAIEKVWYNPCP